MVERLDNSEDAQRKTAFSNSTGRKKVLIIEQDSFSSLAIRTGFQMFGIDCDIAFRAKFALELVCKRLATKDVDAMYKLIVIDKSLNN